MSRPEAAPSATKTRAAVGSAVPAASAVGGPAASLTGASAPSTDVDDPLRNRILRAAADNFGRHGYAATSVEAILASAEVSRRTFYKRFRNKEDVLRSLFERTMRLLVAAVAQAAERQLLGQDEPHGATEAAVEAYVRGLAAAGPLSRLLLQEQFAPDSPVSEARDRAKRTFTRMLTEGAVMRGAPAPDPVLVAGVVAAINQICVAMAEVHPGGDWDIARAKKAIMRLIATLDG